MDQNIRTDILKNTIKVFNKKGLKLTMDDVAGYMGISKKTIYKCYDSKEEIFGEIVDYNPYYALQKNANPQPKFLDGWEQDEMHELQIHLVIVRYNRRCLCCTRETMESHELEFVRNVKHPSELEL